MKHDINNLIDSPKKSTPIFFDIVDAIGLASGINTTSDYEVTEEDDQLRMKLTFNDAVSMTFSAKVCSALSVGILDSGEMLWDNGEIGYFIALDVTAKRWCDATGDTWPMSNQDLYMERGY